MDDLTQRLRNAPNWMREGFGKSWKDTGLTFDRAPFEAADEIDRLRAELVRTNERWEKSHQTALAIQDERDALRAEVEGLRALVNDAVLIVRDFATRNPKYEYDGCTQDPWGAHQWIARYEFDAARKP